MEPMIFSEMRIVMDNMFQDFEKQLNPPVSSLDQPLMLKDFPHSIGTESHRKRFRGFCCDLIELEDCFKLYCDLPGLRKEEIDLQLKENMLYITGDRKPHEVKEGERFCRNELPRGRFTRKIMLPDHADLELFTAKYHNDGVLEMNCPKLSPFSSKKVAVADRCFVQTAVACPDCQERMERSLLPAHQVSLCPEALVLCAYGCGQRVRRKDMAAHVESDVTGHLKAVVEEVEACRGKLTECEGQLAAVRAQCKECAYPCSPCQAALHEWQGQLAAVQLKVQQQELGRGWHEWRVYGMQERIRQATKGGKWNKVELWSPPVQTEAGYTVSFLVDINGDKASDAGHLGLYVAFSSGPQDDFLRWPFQGVVRCGADGVEQEDVTMDSVSNREWTAHRHRSRPAEGGRNVARGWETFAPHAAVTGDCVTFRVRVEPMME